MRETFTSVSVGGAPGNRCFYPEMQSNAVIEMSLHFSLSIELLQTLRLLDQSRSVNLKDLGLPEKAEKTIKHVISRPQGIILVTGPTGSGKSTTLYTCLREFNAPSRSIMTVEDPVEYDIPGIDQSPGSHNL